MSRNLSDLEKVIRFLNANLSKLAKAVEKNETEELATRQRFLESVSVRSDLKIVSIEPADRFTQSDVSALLKFQAWLRITLTEVLAENSPTKALHHLFDGINRRIHNRPMHWGWKLHSARVLPRQQSVETNLHFHGYSWWLERFNAEGGIETDICHSVMRVLELDQLHKMRVCGVCRRFFYSNFNRTRFCPGRVCKRKNDICESGSRKAKSKAKHEALQLTVLWKQQKQCLTTAIKTTKCVMSLDFNLSERFRVRDRLLKDLTPAESEDEFWSLHGNFKFKARIEKHLGPNFPNYEPKSANRHIRKDNDQATSSKPRRTRRSPEQIALDRMVDEELRRLTGGVV